MIPIPSPATVDALQHRLLEWYATHQRDLPWRRTKDPYTILVAEIMLQQTQVERVLPKFHHFLALFPTWQALAMAPARDVIRAWSSLGYNQRAVRLQRIAQQVVGQFGGRLPETVPELRTLKGVGPYTATAIASFVYRQDAPVVDTNVRRVLSRLMVGLGKAEDAGLRRAAAALLPAGRSSQWNQALMDLGATICHVRRPGCFLCPLREWCVAAPQLQSPVNRVAERASRYTVRSAPFHGSTRYYRGRIVERLRHLSDGEATDMEALGRAIKKDFATLDVPWLLRLLEGLQRDGLVKLMETGAQEGGQNTVMVGLP